tara:strand:- start:2566 stop:2889 length:324 start_codon:yes stop_codon:yes gene_type:complete
MSKSKEYFPNKWEAYNRVPANKYESLPFDFFMEMKDMWSLKRSHICVVRVKKNGRIKEHAYKQLHAAKKKVSQLLKDSDEFTVLTFDAMHTIHPKELFRNEEPYPGN